MSTQPSVPAPPAAAAAPRPAPGGGLVARGAPPLRLPTEHFAAALGFWLLGAFALVWAAPSIASGAFPLPRVVATTHLFTLGWITTSILGALYQFLPVALQVPIRSTRIAHMGFTLYVPGLLLFIGGLLLGRAPLVLGGAVLFGSALLLFVGNLAATLKRAPERNLTWWALAGAALFLTITVVLGAALAGNLSRGYLGAHRFLALGVHLHVATAGWVLLVMLGVAHRLLPMFLLSHGAPEWPAKLALALVAAGVALLVALHHALTPPLTALTALLMGSGVIAFLAQAALFFRHKKKPTLDPGLRLAGVGLAHLLLAVLIAPLFLTEGLAAPRLATAYGVALVLGALSLFVAGHYYKILPFLIWFHRFGPLVGKQKVPRVVDLYAARPANAAVVLLGAGAFGVVLSTLAGVASAARAAAVLYALGAVVVAAQMFTISRGRPE
jgi:hypothetical protein